MCSENSINCFTFVDLKAQALQLRREMSCCYLLVFGELTRKGIKRCLLLADSWSSNKNQELFQEVLGQFPVLDVKKLIIPERTTGMIQPLDVFYFRPYKQFVRHISDSLEISHRIWWRDHYFSLQAFAHYQFSAPIFRKPTSTHSK